MINFTQFVIRSKIKGSCILVEKNAQKKTHIEAVAAVRMHVLEILQSEWQNWQFLKMHAKEYRSSRGIFEK